VTNPGLILADEPTAALDKVTGRQIVELLQGIARSQSIPILMVTHDSRILDIADRIVRIEDGRLLKSSFEANKR
jgi:putative ABC transport system ATP-binding protein